LTVAHRKTLPKAIYQCYDRVSASRAFHRIIWNVKRQNVQVCVNEVASSVHDTPAMFTAKPPGRKKPTALP
jgi:hypothetical protein